MTNQIFIRSDGDAMVQYWREKKVRVHDNNTKGFTSGCEV